MNFRKNWRSMMLVPSTAVLLLTGCVYVYGIVDHYRSMKIKEIDTFETFWPNVFDEKTKLVKKVSDEDIKKLKSLAQTPTDKSRAIFIDISNKMSSLTQESSSLTIDQILSILADYQINEKHDDSYTDQQSINTSILSKAEEFVKNVKESVSYLHFSDDHSQLTFDQNVTQFDKIPTISTEIRWNKLDIFNSKISELNSSMESQIKENQDRDLNVKMIELQPPFDKFIKEVDELKNSLKNEYVKMKTLRDFEKIIKKLDTSKADWLNDKSVFDYVEESKTTKTYLSDKFFEDNPTLDTMKSDLKLIPINVEIKSEILETSTKSNEKKSMTAKIDMTDFSGTNDDDLIKKSSIYNLKIDLTVDQVQVRYKETRRPQSTTPSSSQTRSSSERRQNR